MRSRTLLILALVVAIMTVVAWSAIRVLQTAAAPAAAETPITRVKRGPVTISVAARGTLQGGNAEMLIAPMVGSDSLTVTTLLQSGELAQAGDVVVQFDTTQQEYNLREAEADLAEAQQRVIQTQAENQASDEETRYALEAAKTQVKLAELERRRNPLVAAMVARQNDIALEGAHNRLRQAEQDIANKKTTTAAGLAIQKAAENRSRMMAAMAQKNIESMTLKAKSGGYVNLQSNTFGLMMFTSGMTLPTVQIGDTVRPGMAVAQIPDLNNWEVSAQVAELDRGHLAAGQVASIAVVALGGKSFPGHVKELGNTTGLPWDRKFESRMTLDQSGPELRPGMTCNVVITAERLDNVTWAPSQALFERDGRFFVYLKTPKGFTPRDVTLVKRSESQVVLTGVNEGDVVALSNPTEQSKPAASEKQSAMKAIPK
jgi:multidrug efflux pump subunit AcrA (membrane-fusion protein)